MASVIEQQIQKNPEFRLFREDHTKLVWSYPMDEKPPSPYKPLESGLVE